MKKFEKLSISKFHSMEVREMSDIRGGKEASITDIHGTGSDDKIDANDVD